MSIGNLHFLGENPDFRVLTDQIFARNEISGSTILIPFRIEFSSFGRNGVFPFSKATINYLKGELRTKDSSIKCSETMIFGCHTISETQHTFQSQFQFLVSYETINKIEKQRKGDLPLILSVVSQAAVYDDIMLSNKQNKSFVTDFNQGSGHINFTIPQSYWINNILPQTGYQLFRLIEIPSMSNVIPLEYSKSLKELEEAKKYFLNGDFDKTVGHCRSALDPFKPKKDELKTFIKSKSELIWINEVLEATDEWLVKLIKSTSHFTSKSHHIPSVGHFGRVEAEIIMMITVALISYVGKLDGKSSS